MLNSNNNNNNNNDSLYGSLQILSTKDFIAGWASGIASISVGHPLETIKVRQQTAIETVSVSRHVTAMLRNEGLRCLFRGLSYPLYTTGVLNSVYFGFYGNSLRLLESGRGECHFRSCCDGDGDGDGQSAAVTVAVYRGWHWHCFYAGLVGGTVSTLLNTPIELAKTVVQARAISSRSNESLTPTKCLIDLFRTRGLRGCYHGGIILLIRDVPTLGLYAVCYEHTLCMQKNHSQTYSASQLIMYEGVAGGIAGVLTWLLAVPTDVIKSRYMYDSINGEKYKKYSGIVDCVKVTYRESGIKAFYKGLWITLIRAFPVNFICFVTYERTLKILNKYL